MNKLAALTLLTASAIAPAFAQAPTRKLASPQDESAPAPRSFEYKYLTYTRAQSVVAVVEALLPRVHLQLVGSLNTIIIRGQSQERVDQAEQLIRKYDVPRAPQREVQFTAYLIQGAKAGDAKVAGAMPVPAALQSAIAEMKSTFAYESYHLIDAVVTNSQEGTAEYQGTLPGSPAGENDVYTLSYSSVRTQDEAKTITIRQFEFKMLSPYLSTEGAPQYGTSRIKSDLVVHEGQKLILGKVRRGSNADIFLVVTAKVL